MLVLGVAHRWPPQALASAQIAALSVPKPNVQYLRLTLCTCICDAVWHCTTRSAQPAHSPEACLETYVAVCAC